MPIGTRTFFACAYNSNPLIQTLFKIAFLLLAGTASLSAQLIPGAQERREEAQELYPDLAEELENPLARILIFPLNFNYEKGGGPDGSGERFGSTFAPSIPFILNNEWRVLSKTEISWVHQQDVTLSGTQEGWSDMIQTFFVTPRRSIGWDSYWGIGPTFILPTASEDGLGKEKYSAGPSIAVYRQTEAWTSGILLNHAWSFAGDDEAADVSVSLIEPVLSYTNKHGTVFRLGAEFRHDWERNHWKGPLQIGIGQLTLVRNHPVKFGFGYSHYLLDEGHTADWGVEFQITVPIESPRWSFIR